MKKLLILIAVLIILCNSCINLTVPRQGAAITVNLSEQSYEILGRVDLTETITSICGFYTQGGNGYISLLKEAKKKYSADEIINVNYDVQIINNFIVFSKIKYIYTAIAIRYK